MNMENIEDIYPLSLLQESLLTPGEREGRPEPTTGQWSCRLLGDLDVSRFERAWQHVAARQPVLRTSFVWKRVAQPLQVVHKQSAVPFEIHDWREAAAGGHEGNLAELLRREDERGFDPAKLPLVRTALCRLDENAHLLVVSYHKLILDERSLKVLLAEVAGEYASLAGGSGAPPRPAPLFSDYVAWLGEQDLTAAQDYWRQALRNYSAPTALNVGRAVAEPGGETAREVRRAELSPATAGALRALADEHGLTAQVLVGAAWALLLSSYSGEEEVVFGVAVTGSMAAPEAAESMIAPLANVLPLRTRIDEETQTLRWLLDLQAQHDRLQEFSYSPPARIREWAGLPDTLSLYESVVAFAGGDSDDEVRDAGGQFRASEMRAHDSDHVPLRLEASGGAGWKLQISFDGSRFDGQTVERMLAHLETLLAEMSARPAQNLSGVSLLSEAERRYLLAELNETRSDYPRDRCVHELFEEQVERAPDAVAVAFGDRQLTYRELNAEANRLAHHLRAMGVGAEMPVGVMMERSVGLVVSLLAILKAGGAYLPLDPEYPLERLDFMLQDAQLSVLITEDALLDNLPVFFGQVVSLDGDAAHLAAASAENPPHRTTGEHLAYIIYTSGSTGRPKGISILHRAVTRLVRDTNYVEIRPADRIAQASNASFDAFTFELWGALLNGACLVGISREVMLTPTAFAAQIREQHISVLFLTTALFNKLAGAEPRAFSGVRHLLFGGEAVEPKWVRKVLAEGAPGRLLHVYGPTESTTYATWYEVGEVEERAATVPIGRPLSNTEAYLLDAKLKPVAVGVPGQLYLGGDGLARDYLGRPGLTAESFIPHPFGREPGARLYRTGDLMRYQPTGDLEFLGRVDDQVKVRGFRIELGEIEAVLRTHPAAKEAAVLAREDGGQERRLVAYLVCDGDAAPTASEWRSFVGTRLPDYMIPSAFVLLDELPLTPNGKVDRKRLPAPDESRPALDPAFAPPRTPVEEMLAGLWGTVLQLSSVGIHDNFFELGGHSLLATQVISHVRAAFGVEVALRSLFERPTVAGLAREVEAGLKAGAGLEAPPVARVSREGALPLSFAQQRLWFIDQLEPGSSFYNIPMAVRLSGRLDAAALHRVLTEIVRRHEALRTSFGTEEGQPVQVIHEAAPIEMPLTDLSHLPADEREAEALRLAGVEARLPFDLSTGPLMRAELLRLSEEEHVVLLTVHHIISDGWSMGVLIREVTLLYEAYTSGQESPLEELPVQYADYAAWQRGWLQGEVLEEQLAYWRSQLGTEPAVLELPTDRPRPAVQSFRGAAHTLSLDGELTASLKEAGRREGVTLFMLLLASFQTLLHRYTGAERVNVGTPIANRTRVETEGLIGFFVNTLVLPAELEGTARFTELLVQVRERALGAYAHQDVPFEKLVEELQPERSLSHSPLFQVMFALQNAPGGEAVEVPGLVMRGLALDTGTAKFELTLTMFEQDDRLGGFIEYNTDLFDEATIARLERHLGMLLEGVAANAEQRLSEIPILSEGERQQLLVEWNETAAVYPADSCVHELFEAQAARTPDNVAVVFNRQRLTYRELNGRANQLAHHLQRLGVSAEKRVGVLLERSSEMVIALLAVLKAGGAYVPLDPAYPQERLALMLEDTGGEILLTESALAERLDGSRVSVIRVDEVWAEIERESTENPAADATAANLAYVIYTSGSTGQPKGVMVGHASLCNLVAWHQRAYGITTADRATQLAGVGFDASVWELWPYLLAGASLHLPDEETRANPGKLVNWLAEEEISVCFLPTPLAEAAFQEPWPEGLRLRALLTGGDKLHRAPDRDLPFTLVNHYGPTESTVVTTCATVAPAPEATSAPPIGRPISNIQVYVLDNSLRPVPVGVPGELFVGGEALARGYLNSPRLTAERFIPDPFSAGPGRRLYRTGDRVRYLPGGDLEYLERVDQQVKIRGFRIELGEIEAVLARHPPVRDAAVTARDDLGGGKRLVGYVAADWEGGLTTDELVAYLRAKLPEYMIPNVYVKLDELPLTSSGKVDRRGLPAPDQAGLALERVYVAPRTPTEEVLADIFSKVLGVERVGIHDNFFEVGGHSLLATQLISRVRDAFRIEIPLKMFFAGASTVARLAEAVEEIQFREASEDEVAAMLRELDDLSDEEVKALLAGEASQLGRESDNG